jgi:hypothetical protein
MAKREPQPPLAVLVEELGYEVDPVAHPHSPEHLYTDLSPVNEDLSEKTRRELASRQAANQPVQPVPVHDKLSNGINITENGAVGYLRFSVKIDLTTTFSIRFLMSQTEVLSLISSPKEPAKPGTSIGALAKLPPEIREKIFSFALPLGTWEITNTEESLPIFLGSLGSCSNFFYPLAGQLGILSVNQQVRQESLPLAFRRTLFRFDDMDELIKFLLSIGRSGRENIETLDFPWTSVSETSERWALFPGRDVTLQLPSLHVARCITLLSQCCRLRLLRIQMQAALLDSLPIQDFQGDPGIKSLSSLQPIKEVVIYDPFDENVGDHNHAIWLKNYLQRNNHHLQHADIRE